MLARVPHEEGHGVLMSSVGHGGRCIVRLQDILVLIAAYQVGCHAGAGDEVPICVMNHRAD
jgi:hypothetical protein